MDEHDACRSTQTNHASSCRCKQRLCEALQCRTRVHRDEPRWRPVCGRAKSRCEFFEIPFPSAVCRLRGDASRTLRAVDAFATGFPSPSGTRALLGTRCRVLRGIRQSRILQPSIQACVRHGTEFLSETTELADLERDACSPLSFKETHHANTNRRFLGNSRCRTGT